KYLALVGRNTHRTYRIGQAVKVKVVNVDKEQSKIDFDLVDPTAAPVTDLLPKREHHNGGSRGRGNYGNRNGNGGRNGDHKRSQGGNRNGGNGNRNGGNGNRNGGNRGGNGGNRNHSRGGQGNRGGQNRG